MIQQYEVRIPDDSCSIERAFLAALVRLVTNRPRDPELSKQAGKGQIKPTQSKVAIEAGHSRTLISGKSSPYPRVQVEIRRANDWYLSTKRPQSAMVALDGYARESALRNAVHEATELREEMKRQRDAAYTSEAACVMLAQEMRRNAKANDVDVTAMRRKAEQKVLTSRGMLGS